MPSPSSSLSWRIFSVTASCLCLHRWQYSSLERLRQITWRNWTRWCKLGDAGLRNKYNLHLWSTLDTASQLKDFILLRKVHAILDAPALQNVTQLHSFRSWSITTVKSCQSCLVHVRCPLFTDCIRKMELECCAEEHLPYCQEAVDSTLPNGTLQSWEWTHFVMRSVTIWFGAVMSQPNVDGSEKPVAFASQSLNLAERSTPK